MNPCYVDRESRYEEALYPGQKVQIDVKVVPSVCIVGQAHEEGKKFYQYTAIDECTRLRYLAALEEPVSYTHLTLPTIA